MVDADCIDYNNKYDVCELPKVKDCEECLWKKNREGLMND